MALAFERFELTDSELHQATEFNEALRKLLKNFEYEVVTQKLQIEFVPSDPLKFQQAEAYLRGKLDLLGDIFTARELYFSTRNNLQE